MISALLLASVAMATDWVSLQGLEPVDPERAALRGFGFVQVLGEGAWPTPVQGLESEGLAPYNGQVPVFNHVAGKGQSTAMSLRRVRVGVRGEIPGTQGMWSTFAALELGQNGVTMSGGEWRPTLMDASITYRSPTPVHLRVGRFKIPMADATLEAVHTSADLLQFSLVTRRLLLDREIAENGSEFTGRANGFRDVGVQLFGSHTLASLELSWAAMVGTGEAQLAARGPGADLTLRAQASWLLSDAPARKQGREELSFWVWGQSGGREINESSVQRTRAGVGVQLQKAHLRARVEGLYAQGVLNTGASFPFGTSPIAMAPDGQAWGSTALLSYRWETLELGMHWGHLDSQFQEPAAERIFEEVTGFAQLHVGPKVIVAGNLMWRQGRAPQGSADAQRILESFSPYGGLQFTVIAP
jgi:hypothetical protein